MIQRVNISYITFIISATIFVVSIITSLINLSLAAMIIVYSTYFVIPFFIVLNIIDRLLNKIYKNKYTRWSISLYVLIIVFFLIINYLVQNHTGSYL